MASILKNYPSIAVISDEVYRTMAHDDFKYDTIANYLPDQSLIIGGLSKEYAGTGLRIGWVAGPEPYMRFIAKVQGIGSSCCCLITQRAYAKFMLIDKDMKERKEMQKNLSKSKGSFDENNQRKQKFE